MDYDTARYERDLRMNPPSQAPGQDGSDLFGGGNMNGGSGFDSMFGSSSQPVQTGQFDSLFQNNVGGGSFGGGSFGNDPFGSGSFGGGGGNIGGDPFGGGGFGGGFNSGNNMGLTGGIQQQTGQAQSQQKMSGEDIFFELLKKTCTGIADTFKDIFGSMSTATPLFWNVMAKDMMFGGVGSIVIGLALRIMGYNRGFNICGGAAFAVAGAAGLFALTYDKGQLAGKKFTDVTPDVVPVSDNSVQPSSAWDSGSSSDFNSAFNMGGMSDFSSSSSSFNASPSFSDSDEPEYYEEEEEEEYEEEEDDEDWLNKSYTPVNSTVDLKDALSRVPDVPKGMYTRQVLFDTFMSALPNMIPNFNKVTELYDDDDEFIWWSEKLREAAEVAGCKEENLPELLSLKCSMATLVLECTRPAGFKLESTATELANIYAYKDGSFNEKSYAKTDTNGKTGIITVFTGKSEMISLKDMIMAKKDFFLDSSNYMPVVLGVDQQFDVIVCDFRKPESVIVAGMPRSGKSWFVQAILAQMCAFVSPKDLNLYICDPKDGISDFKSFVLPHVKKFVSGDANIVSTLRNVVKVEAPRRKKIIGDAGFVNIWDYKKKNPLVELPVIYVVIDEVVTLAERMEKETKQEFQGLLVELISQLPALGIRAFLVPHVVKNDIIAKTASDLVDCRISVKGNAEHIEAVTATKPKDFPFKLNNIGDMAVRMPSVSAKTMFIHGPALNKDNTENSDLFDYMRQVWMKYEPDETSGSVAESAMQAKAQEDLLNSSQDFMNTDDIDLFSDSVPTAPSNAVPKSSPEDDFMRSIFG